MKDGKREKGSKVEESFEYLTKLIVKYTKDKK